MTGIITLSSKFPEAPAQAMVASLPMTCGATMSSISRDHRVDLARHDRAAGLELGDADLADPAARPGGEPADVVGDLRQADADRPQRPDASTSPSRLAIASKLVRRLAKRQAGLLGEPRDHRWAKSGCVLIPVPTAVPPSGQLADRRPRALQPAEALPHLAAYPATPARAGSAPRPAGGSGRS